MDNSCLTMFSLYFAKKRELTVFTVKLSEKNKK